MKTWASVSLINLPSLCLKSNKNVKGLHTKLSFCPFFVSNQLWFRLCKGNYSTPKCSKINCLAFDPWCWKLFRCWLIIVQTGQPVIIEQSRPCMWSVCPAVGQIIQTTKWHRLKETRLDPTVSTKVASPPHFKTGLSLYNWLSFQVFINVFKDLFWCYCVKGVFYIGEHQCKTGFYLN